MPLPEDTPELSDQLPQGMPTNADEAIPDFNLKARALNTVRHRMEDRGEKPAYSFDKILANTIADPNNRELLAHKLLGVMGHPAGEAPPPNGGDVQNASFQQGDQQQASGIGDEENIATETARQGLGPLTAQDVGRRKMALQGVAYQDKKDAQAAMDKYQSKADAATLEHKEAALKLADQYKAQVTQLQDDYSRSMEGQMTRFREAVNNLKAINPNPWANRGTAFAIGSALAIGMNQLGLSMVGSNAPNVALQQINQARERDLKVQQLQLEGAQRNVQAEGSLLGHMQSVFHDKQTALLAAKAAGMEQIVARADAEFAKLLPAQRSAQAEAFIKNLHAQLATDMQKVYDTAHTQHYQDFANEMAGINARIKAEGLKLGERRLGLQAAGLGLRRQQFEQNQPNDIFGAEVHAKGVERTDAVNAYSAMQGVPKAYDNLRGLMTQPFKANPEKDPKGFAEEVATRVGLVENEKAVLMQYLRGLTKSGAAYSPEEMLNNSGLAGLNTSTLEKLFSSKVGVNRALKILGEGYKRIHTMADATIFSATRKRLSYWQAKGHRIRQDAAFAQAAGEDADNDAGSEPDQDADDQ